MSLQFSMLVRNIHGFYINWAQSIQWGWYVPVDDVALEAQISE